MNTRTVIDAFRCCMENNEKCDECPMAFGSKDCLELDNMVVTYMDAICEEFDILYEKYLELLGERDGLNVRVKILENKLNEYESSGLEPKTVQQVAEFMKLYPTLCEKYLKGDV